MNQKYTLNEILNKEQYAVKLNVAHFLCSGANCLIVIFFTLIPISFLNACCLYLIAALFAYRFIFSYTKNGKQYEPYLINKFAKLQKKIREKINEKR